LKKIIVYSLTALLIITIFLIGSTREKDYTKDIKNDSGIVLRTELPYYAKGTTRILAFWENNTKEDVAYGQPYTIDRYDEDAKKWIPLTLKDNYGFTMESLGLEAGWINKHTYNLNSFKEEITEGRYRIRADFRMNQQDIDVAAEFTITKEPSLIEVSELAFSDIENSKEIPIWLLDDESKGRISFPIHAYKNKQTFNTTIVVEGKNYHTNIAIGNGTWGVVEGFYAIKDNDYTYLVYSFSRVGLNEEHLSYIGIYNLTTNEETYVSKAYSNYDIGIAYKEKGLFNASFMEYEEFDSGGSSASSVYDEEKGEYKELGNFTIKDGKVVFTH